MTASRQWSFLIIIVLLLILSWLIMDALGPANPIRNAFAEVITPLQYVVRHATRPLDGLIQGVSRVGGIPGQIDALEEENAHLRSQIVLMREAQIENENLRRQLNFKSAVPNYQLLSAEVIGYDPSNLLQYLIIDRGTEDGIQRGLPVLTDAGLVGRISQVTRNSSKVMLITDVSSSVSGYVQRSRSTGIIQGHLGSELVMRYIPQGETVVPGDVVLTSGLGGNFPRRLVVGQVVNVRNKDVEMFQEATVVPAVNLRDLEMVMVLLNFTSFDLPDAE